MTNDITNMSISLPKEMKEQVKRRAKEDHFSTPSDYVRSLVREDLRRLEQERLENALLQGLRSGRGMEIKSKRDWKKFWNKIDAQGDNKHTKRYA